MNSQAWANDSCEQVQSYYTLYPVPTAAALWCGIPAGEVQEHLQIAEQVHRAVFRHPYIPCLEPRCRAIHEAIEQGILLVSRESGKAFDGSTQHVAPERRHVSRSDLKEWIAREFPSDKPKFLFDEIERTTHTAINADSFRALQAERDALKARIERAETAWKEQAAPAIKELEALKRNASQLATTERNTLLVIIAALCKYSEIDLDERGATTNVAQRTDDIGAPVSDDTVRKVLGQIPDALATRKKA